MRRQQRLRPRGAFGGALASHAASRSTLWPNRPVPQSWYEEQGPYAGLGPRNYRRSDERIREEVCERLLEDSYVDASEVEVRVEGGVVTLSGAMSDRAQKWRAEDLCDEVRGVVDVECRIRCHPSRAGDSVSRSTPSPGRAASPGARG